MGVFTSQEGLDILHTLLSSGDSITKQYVMKTIYKLAASEGQAQGISLKSDV